MRKIFLSLFFVVSIMTPAMAGLASSGKTGTCDWTFDSTTGLLTISSSSDAPDWGGELKLSNPFFSPFAANDDIKEVMIEEGVSEIGTGAFMSCKNLKKITFSSTVAVIGFSDDESADDVLVQLPFYECTGLETLIFKSKYAPDTDNRIFDRKTEDLYAFDPSKVNLFINDESVRSFLESGWGVFHICSLPPVAEGKFGNQNQFSWKLSANGKLTVMGQGAMPDFASAAEQPWISYANQITELVVAEGVTHIGDMAFGLNINIESAYLPVTLESIGKYAFSLTNKLKEIICASVVVPKLEENALPTITDETRYIYVWSYMKSGFEANENWAKHKIVEFGAAYEILTFTDVDVEAYGENTIYIKWPEVAGATTYVISIISEDGSMAYDVYVNKDGKVTSYVKKATRPTVQYKLEESIDGFGLEVNGLGIGQKYNITVIAKDDVHILATYSTSTYTVSQVTTPINEPIIDVTEENSTKVRKLLRDGQIIILRENKTYNMLGKELK